MPPKKYKVREPEPESEPPKAEEPKPKKMFKTQKNQESAKKIQAFLKRAITKKKEMKPKREFWSLLPTPIKETDYTKNLQKEVDELVEKAKNPKTLKLIFRKKLTKLIEELNFYGAEHTRMGVGDWAEDFQIKLLETFQESRIKKSKPE